MTLRARSVMTAMMVALSCAHRAPAAVSIDPALSRYQPTSGVSGNLSIVGSDTMAQLVTLWAERFKRFHPGVNIQLQASGSSTAPTALTEGTANLGPMSRAMKKTEMRAFERRYGYPAMAVLVAVDAVALFVHRDNPLAGLSLSQVDAIFSSTRKCGAPSGLVRWSELGLSGVWAHRNMVLFGRNSVSGTYGFFKDRALCRGDFKNSVNEQPGSSSVVQAVSRSINSIAYAGIGYKTPGVRSVPLGSGPANYVAATQENALAGSYPLVRFLYVYVNKAPGHRLAPLDREFIDLVLSQLGQSAVAVGGYIPLPVDLIERQRRLLAL